VRLVRRVLPSLVRVAILFIALAVLIKLLGPPVAIFPYREMGGLESSSRQGHLRNRSSITRYPKSREQGYGFEIPWSGSIKKKVFRKDGLVQLEFESRQNVPFYRTRKSERSVNPDCAGSVSAHE
jgi:hypothetical protein